MFESIDWRIFFLLTFSGFLGLLSVQPLKRSFLQIIGKKIPFSGVSHRLTSILLMTGVLAVAIYAGTVLSRHLGLPGTPFLDQWFTASTVALNWKPVAIAIVSGLGLGVLLSISSFMGTQQSNQAFYGIALWKHLLAGLLHGGIVEELVFRWFLLSLLAWSTSWIFGLSLIPLSDHAFWTANVVAALLFGLAHLPASAALAPLTPVIITLTLLLNGMAGVIYGYLLMMFGLEAAVLAHMSTHITLQPCVRAIMALRRNRATAAKTLQTP